MDVAARAMTGLLMSDPGDARVAEFADLVQRQGKVMFRIAMAVLRRSEDAEEAVQEAFLRMYRSEGWRSATEEKAYVGRVVWRVAVDRAKERQKRRYDEDVADMELAAEGERGEESLERADGQRRLRQLMNGLPEEMRRPLLLCAIEEMSSREAAEVMGVPEGTVRTRVMRAKEELRRRWESAGSRRQGGAR